MGNWNINISGTGPHHNQNPACDVDLIARKLISELVANGHSITSARLHHGAAEEFGPRKDNEATRQQDSEDAKIAEAPETT